MKRAIKNTYLKPTCYTIELIEEGIIADSGDQYSQLEDLFNNDNKAAGDNDYGQYFN